MSIRTLSLGLAALLLGACGSAGSQDDRLSVVATIYPLAHFAEQLGGDAASVESIVPGGVEPHDFEPTPRDIGTMLGADVLLINGAGIDSWAASVAEEARSQGVTVLVMEDALTFLESEHADDDHDAEEHGPLDPHFWLDPQKASAATLEIAEALAAKDSENAERYREGAKAFERRMMALDEAFTEGLASCPSRSAIVSHDAFGYLAARHDLELYPIAGLSTEEEPSAKQMGTLVKLAREKRIPVVFFESLVSPRLADVLAAELNLQALPLNPLEGITPEEGAAGETYESIMRKNLENLRTGLRCP